ncbi:hypothetical protein [Phycicoccus elongatus]|uniref:hypothetical protein n=1 Tax=Phycicoccus elongatus TaxID=101689 RepID=UPI0037845026
MINTSSVASTGDSAAESAGSGDQSISTSTAANSSGASSSGGTTQIFDLGTMPDVGGPPVGCKGKIDLLFVISRASNMRYRQEQLIDAFPKFIDTITAKFADFDYHIMVVDGDSTWGSSICDDVCPTLACKIEEPCCGLTSTEPKGEPCCASAPDYPCEHVAEKTVCDDAFGAGTVFPAGTYSSNKLCPLDVQRRYMVKGEPNLKDTFACVARVGVSGHGRLGQALTAAVQKGINDPGGCNPGFLRKDALLMVTLISTNGDSGGGGLDSKGTPEEWAQAVLDAKQGVAESIVLFNIGYYETECDPMNGLCTLAKMFPYHHFGDVLATDYGPAFDDAASLVETACAGFMAPG